MKIHNYNDFVDALLKCGFSMGSSNSENIFTLCPYDFSDINVSKDIKWHTGDPDTDPWEWRMRVLVERDDIAYSKVFFKKSGYITKEWYPYFFALRRKGESFDEAYYNGSISQTAKLIYKIIEKNGATPLHEIKRTLGFTKNDNSRFEQAMIELQMQMFITMCGRQQKLNKYGDGYGWSSTVFTTTESFWNERNFDIPMIDHHSAMEKIEKQILELNANANKKRIEKFIKG